MHKRQGLRFETEVSVTISLHTLHTKTSHQKLVHTETMTALVR